MCDILPNSGGLVELLMYHRNDIMIEELKASSALSLAFSFERGPLCLLLLIDIVLVRTGTMH